MATATRAIDRLRSAGVDFVVHTYEVGESGLSYGEAVAAALGAAPERLFKTLVARVDGRPVVGIVPVSGRLSLKGLARAVGGKRAELAGRNEAERLTGYVAGGISPFAQRRSLPIIVDGAVRGHDTVLVSAGRRGLQVELAPGDLIAVTRAIVADIAGGADG